MQDSPTEHQFKQFFELIKLFQPELPLKTYSLITPVTLLLLEDFFLPTESSLPENDRISESSPSNSVTTSSRGPTRAGKSKTAKKMASPNKEWNSENDDLIVKLTQSYKFDWKKIQRRISKLVSKEKSISFLKRRYNILKGKISTNYLVHFSDEEDLKIGEGIKNYGQDWDRISKELDRDPVSVKNRFYFLKRRGAFLEDAEN